MYVSKLSKSKLLDPLGGTWPVTFVHSMKPRCSKGKSSLLLANPVGGSPWWRWFGDVWCPHFVAYDKNPFLQSREKQLKEAQVADVKLFEH